jgi:hypothetical protein
MFEEMVGRPAPVPEVVPGSTPVIAFGDPLTATVATLGINPSWRKFLTDDGSLLCGRAAPGWPGIRRSMVADSGSCFATGGNDTLSP